MLKEASVLLKEIGFEKLERFGLEYKYLAAHLIGKMSYDEMLLQLETAIRQFSKRQMTYFRKMQKDGLHIHWINENEPSQEVISTCRNFLHK